VALAVVLRTGGLTLLVAGSNGANFLLRVTGIPPTEAQALASRGERLSPYQRTTQRLRPLVYPRRRLPLMDPSNGPNGPSCRTVDPRGMRRLWRGGAAGSRA
jgi:hypothetical protein